MQRIFAQCPQKKRRELAIVLLYSASEAIVSIRRNAMSAKVTVAELKEALKMRDLPTTGIKADLEARLQESVQTTTPLPRPANGGFGTASPKRPSRDGSMGKAKKSKLFPEDAEGGSQEDSAEYVPRALYKLLSYSLPGEKDLSTPERVLFTFVAGECTFPDDFKHNIKYGSLSGVSYEERAIFSYIHGQLSCSDRASKLRLELLSAVVDGDYTKASVIVS